jgi:nicotinamidase-related amidase
MPNTALIIIDIQNDYFPEGNHPLARPIEATEQAVKILTVFREKNLPLFYIQHFNTREGADYLVPDSEGAEIHSLVAPLENEVVISKHFPNAFRETDLLEKVKEANVNHLVVLGMMSHMCVESTTRAAFDLGFTVTVAEDACTTTSLEREDIVVPAQTVHDAYMAGLNGIFANVLSTEEILEGIN